MPTSRNARTSRVNAKSNSTKKFKARIEALESRELMTASGSFFPGLPLTINASDSNDIIEINEHSLQVEVRENGESSWFGRPSAIFLFANGGDDRIFNNTSVPSFIYGGDGNDLIYSGRGNDSVWGGNGADNIDGEEGDDFIDGGSGNDYINGYHGNDRIFGGSGDDQAFGTLGNDTLYGGAGNDRLDGGSHRDRIFGEDGNDELFGYRGDDDLYGGNGVDALYGGEGDDGLFGGGLGDSDRLEGQQGDDRFLVNGPDTVVDEVANDDAVITFTNGPQQTVPIVGFGQVQFAAGSWTDAEILNVDVALNNLHHHVGNTSLLETSTGGRVTLQRVGNQMRTLPNESQLLGWNGGSNIAFTNGSFSTNIELYQTIYHEIGHNWDSTTENTDFTAFSSISGWTTGQPMVTQTNWSWSSFWFVEETVADGSYSQAGDGSNWYHKNSWDFARDYGKWNPREDYATTWETYFAEKYHGTTDGNTRVQAKYDNLDRLFARLA